MDYITTVEMSKNGGFHQEEFPFCVVRAECLVQRKKGKHGCYQRMR